MRSKKRLVLPGEQLYSKEEMNSGAGTYECDGEVLSESIGKVKVDIYDKRVEVDPVKRPRCCIRGGDRIVCRVDSMENDRAMLDVLLLAGGDRDVLKPLACLLRIRDACEHYIESISDVYREGDIILGYSIRGSPFVLLKTTEEETGVILARCPECNIRLDYMDRETLVCPECDYKRSSNNSKLYDKEIPGI